MYTIIFLKSRAVTKNHPALTMKRKTTYIKNYEKLILL